MNCKKRLQNFEKRNVCQPRRMNVNFEDALINSLAETHNMDAILTNNVSDFIKLDLQVYCPVDFIALFK